MTGIENGNCEFTIEFLNLDGSAIDLTVFGLHDTVFSIDPPVWWEYRSISSVPILTWESSDMTKIGLYDLKIVMTDNKFSTP